MDLGKSGQKSNESTNQQQTQSRVSFWFTYIIYKRNVYWNIFTILTQYFSNQDFIECSRPWATNFEKAKLIVLQFLKTWYTFVTTNNYPPSPNCHPSTIIRQFSLFFSTWQGVQREGGEDSTWQIPRKASQVTHPLLPKWPTAFKWPTPQMTHPLHKRTTAKKSTAQMTWMDSDESKWKLGRLPKWPKLQWWIELRISRYQIGEMIVCPSEPLPKCVYD